MDNNITKWNDIEKEIDKRNKKLKREAFINNVKTKAKNGLNWVKDHPVETMLLVTTTITTGAKVIKLVEEYDHRYMRQYDPSADAYISLRRPMSRRESNEFALRRREGEKVSDILLDMKLMKR